MLFQTHSLGLKCSVAVLRAGKNLEQWELSSVCDYTMITTSMSPGVHTEVAHRHTMPPGVVMKVRNRLSIYQCKNGDIHIGVGIRHGAERNDLSATGALGWILYQAKLREWCTRNLYSIVSPGV